MMSIQASNLGFIKPPPIKGSQDVKPIAGAPNVTEQIGSIEEQQTQLIVEVTKKENDLAPIEERLVKFENLKEPDALSYNVLLVHLKGFREKCLAISINSNTIAFLGKANSLFEQAKCLLEQIKIVFESSYSAKRGSELLKPLKDLKFVAEDIINILTKYDKKIGEDLISVRNEKCENSAIPFRTSRNWHSTIFFRTQIVADYRAEPPKLLDLFKEAKKGISLIIDEITKIIDTQCKESKIDLLQIKSYLNNILDAVNNENEAELSELLTDVTHSVIFATENRRSELL